MQKNKTEFNYTVKRLITLSLAVSVGLFNSLPQVSAQSSEEISSHSESYSSDEQESSINENSSVDEEFDEQTGNEDSSQNMDDINALDIVYPENHSRHRPEQRDLLASMARPELTVSNYDIPPIPEPEQRDLLASLARRELTVSNDDTPPIPEPEQVTAYCCLQTVISFITWAFGPCFRGVLGSHKKD